MHRLRGLTLLLALGVSAGLIHAEGAHHQGHSHQAHVHGKAELLVVLEGQQLDIELRSPAVNVLGFEHYTDSPEHQAQMTKVKAALTEAGGLFYFGAGACWLLDQRIDFGALAKVDDDHKGHSDSDLAAEEKPEHSDVQAYYQYRCEQPDKLDSLTADIPVIFPGVESLQVEWIVNGRQGASVLDARRRDVSFR
ncbi:ZrgA family zinc uptake protein [Zhongshania aliphaticivorans]|uniref:ZrgA family zinc uptake protein n=1 Tax=Zhongshania aliphaticivorans TaxID=1470434 RepID=UPI0012E63EC7|nr:DUF2796 domain-containing protein [Zhongshania aliphaticivorans]CAA0112354.1 Uncharacterised protein [Zhongshania aliphaticivorans]